MLDLDLKITGSPVIQTLRHGEGEGGEGGWSLKNFFQPFEPQFGLEIGGGGQAPPGPSPGSATVK